MKNLPSLLLVAASLLALCHLPAQTTSDVQNTSDSDLNSRVRVLDLDKQGLDSYFLGVAGRASIPGGSITVGPCGSKNTKGGTLTEGTVRELMDSLIAENPDYEWHVKDGAINVMPRLMHELFQTSIDRFELTNATSVDRALDQLLSIPAVKNEIARLNLTMFSPEIGFYSMQRPGPKIKKHPEHTFSLDV